MKMNNLWLGMAVAALAASGSVSAQAASVYEELRAANPAAADQVDRGEQVTLTQGAQGPWPKAWVYRVIDARPEEVAAVFWDFPTHKEFYPNVFKSEVSNRVSATTLEVDYAVSVPIFADEFYTVRDTLSSYEEGGRAYKVEWSKVRASSTRHIEGYILIEPHRGKTIIEYYNYIIPGNGMAGFPGVSGRAMAQLNSTVAALGRETERRRREQAGRLADLVRQVRDALGQ
jgi:hypothetical protein